MRKRPKIRETLRLLNSEEDPFEVRFKSLSCAYQLYKRAVSFQHGDDKARYVFARWMGMTKGG